MPEPYLADAQRYDKRPFRRCGRSGLLLSPLALGLWHNFGGVDAEENARALVRHAFDRGVTHFDLANNYGPPPGSAEETFGRLLRSDLAPYRDEIIVTTKAGFRMWPGPYGEFGSRKYLLASLDASLRRLGLPYVDIFYSHRPDSETPLEETAGALVHAVRSGKALYVGISNYDPTATGTMAALLRAEGIPLTVHQPRYSLLSRGPEDGLLDVLGAEGVGAAVFSPLAQGLLAGRYTHGIPADSRAAKPHGFLKAPAVAAQEAVAAALADLAAARGQSPAAFALAWVLRDPRITSAIIGASSTAQIDDNLTALHGPAFSAEELATIDRLTGKTD